MASARDYKQLENRAAQRIGRRVASVAAAFAMFFGLLFRKWRQKFTVMLIPHTEKKIFSFQISVFTMLFVLVLGTVLVVGFFMLSTHFTGTNSRYTEASLSLRNREQAIEALIEEVDQLRQTARQFEAALEGVLDVMDPADVKNLLPTGTGGDLSQVIKVEDFEERGLKEISDLRRLAVYLEGAVLPLEEIESVLESQMDLLVNIPTLWPLKGVRGRITQPFGPAVHPFNGEPYMHKGIDIAWGYHIPIVATADGQVVKVDNDELGLGIYVEVQHKYSFSTRYGHFQKIVVKRGQMVEGGEVIGYMGSTGLSNGPHLHYEVKIGGEIVDPLQFLNIGGRLLTRTLTARN